MDKAVRRGTLRTLTPPVTSSSCLILPFFRYFWSARRRSPWPPDPIWPSRLPRQPREVASPASPVLPASSRGGAIWTVLAAAGLAALLATAEHALTVIRYAGALYLLYLAWKTLRHLDAPLESRGARSSWRAFRRGLVTNLLNPKIGLFFLAFLPQFTNAELSPVWLQMLVLGGIFFSIGTGVLIIVALAAGQAQAWLAGSRTARRALNGLSATAFGGLGLRLILVDDAV